MAQPDIQRLIGEARQNELKMRRFQTMELRLMQADSLIDLCQLLVVEYRAAFKLDSIALHLFDPERELMRLDYSRDLSRLGCVYLHHHANNRLQALCGTRPRLGPYDPIAHRDVFPSLHPPATSVGILPLRRPNRAVGVFALGSYSNNRFAKGDGTDFLQRLATIAGICIDNSLNHERLRQAGLRDPLTNLYNRRHFDDSLRREILAAQRNGSPLACLYMDIDHFKHINDQHGHPVGDQVLQGVAQTLRSQQRMSEVLARMGGEEFALLMPQTELDAARAAGERIRAKLAAKVFEFAPGRTLKATLSCGVASIRPALDDDLEAQAERLLVSADNALLAAKSGGRNRVLAGPVVDPGADRA